MSSDLEAREAAASVGALVFVGGLDPAVTEEVLYNAFIPFGNIKSVNIALDSEGRRRGFGNVCFEDPLDAKEAIENMNDSEIYGRVIRCNLGTSRTARTQGAWTSADLLTGGDQTEA